MKKKLLALLLLSGPGTSLAIQGAANLEFFTVDDVCITAAVVSVNDAIDRSLSIEATKFISIIALNSRFDFSSKEDKNCFIKGYINLETFKSSTGLYPYMAKFVIVSNSASIVTPHDVFSAEEVVIYNDVSYGVATSLDVFKAGIAKILAGFYSNLQSSWETNH